MKRLLREGGLYGRSYEGHDTLVAESPSTCRVETRSAEGALVISLRGELDLSSAAEVRLMLNVADGEAAVVLDLAGVTLIDRAGVRVLDDFIRCVSTEGGMVAVARPSQLARSVLELVGTEGFVFLGFSSAGALAWLDRLPHLQLLAAPADAVVSVRLA